MKPEQTTTSATDQKDTPFMTALIWFGGAALLLVTLIETLSVIAPFFGMSFLGSIEIVEALVLMSGAVGILMASLMQNHARVHLVLDHLPPVLRNYLNSFAFVVSAVFFLACLGGSIFNWVVTRSHFEQSDVLQIPHEPLRILLIGFFLINTVLFVAQFIRSFTAKDTALTDDTPTRGEP